MTFEDLSEYISGRELAEQKQLHSTRLLLWGILASQGAKIHDPKELFRLPLIDESEEELYQYTETEKQHAEQLIKQLSK